MRELRPGDVLELEQVGTVYLLLEGPTRYLHASGYDERLRWYALYLTGDSVGNLVRLTDLWARSDDFIRVASLP